MFRPLLLLYSGLLLCAATACTNVNTLLGQGDIATAYERSLRRVQRSSVPSKKRLSDLLKSYDALQELELAELAQFDPAQDPAQWVEVFYRYDRLYERSLVVDNYRPLGAPAGYRTGVSPRSLGRERETARLNAGQYYLDRARQQVPAARDGDKLAARAAYAEYDRALEFLPERTGELAPLRAEMEELGTVRIFVYAIEGRLDGSLLAEFSQVPDSKIDWVEIVFQDRGRRIDFDAEVFLDRYQVSGPSIDVSSTTYTEEVLDWVEEKEKQVRQGDTTITVVEKIEHYQTVSATVTEIHQSMDLWLHGELVLYRAQAEEPVWITPWATHADWDNDFSECSGDDRALPAAACMGFEDSPPSPGYLLATAARHVDGVMRRELRAYFASATPQNGENDLRE